VIKTAALTATKFVNFNAHAFQPEAPLERVALFSASALKGHGFSRAVTGQEFPGFSP
jgi:hypothetical protein